MLLQAVLLPFQLAVLCILHLIFAITRLVALVRQLSHRSSSTRSRSTTAQDSDHDEQQVTKSVAAGRWSKLPRHLAVVLVSGTQHSFWTTKLRKGKASSDNVDEDLHGMIQDLRVLLRYCDQVGVQDVSIYDERGVLRKNAARVIESLSQSTTPALASTLDQTNDKFSTFRVVAGRGLQSGVSVKAGSLGLAGGTSTEDERLAAVTGREIDSGYGSSDKLSDGTRTPPSPPTASLTASTTTTTTTLPVQNLMPRASSSAPFITVNLLSRASGRPDLAHVARKLALERRQGEVTTDAVIEAIEASSFTEPDLLIVLGGPYLRLHGFPPWELRLTEIYHEPSPGWLPRVEMTWPVLRNALDLYGGAQMRLGR